jgi:hypothetical protein
MEGGIRRHAVSRVAAHRVAPILTFKPKSPVNLEIHSTELARQIASVAISPQLNP